MSQGLRWSIGARLGPEAPDGSMQVPLSKSSGPEKDLEGQKRQSRRHDWRVRHLQERWFEAGVTTIH